MTTLDFELEIDSGAAGTYPVVARALGREVTTSMRLSVPTVEFTLTTDEKPVRELGQRLFEALVSDDVRGLYVASRQRAHEQGDVLRLVLRVRPLELARLPWELLFDPGQQDYPGLSMPLVRYPELLAPRQPLQVALPLRVLSMMAGPGDQHAWEVDEEQRRLRAALAGLERDGLVQLSWVTGQTYNALQELGAGSGVQPGRTPAGDCELRRDRADLGAERGKIILQLSEMAADLVEIAVTAVQGTFELRYLCGIPGGEDENLGQFEPAIESVDFISPAVQEPEQFVVAPLDQCTRSQGSICG